MSTMFNDQQVLGVRQVADGTVLFNNQLVIGVVDAVGALFVNNIRTLGIAVLGADAPVYNDQVVLGVVKIVDGRKLYNGMLVVPVTAVSGALV